MALNVAVHEFPVVLSDPVHVPTISLAVPLERVSVIFPPPFACCGIVMVVDVIVTPVSVSVPKRGPLHVKSELVQVIASAPVPEVQVYVPLAVCVPVPAVVDGFADA